MKLFELIRVFSFSNHPEFTTVIGLFDQERTDLTGEAKLLNQWRRNRRFALD